MKALIKNIGVLSIGTLVGHSLTVFSLPLLTRLYTPEDYKLLAVYAALLALGTVVANLRLNLAISKPNENSEAASLLVCSLLAAFMVAFTALCILVALYLTGVLDGWGFLPFSWLIPLGILFSGWYQALLYWSARRQRFTLVATTKATRAASSVGAQTSFAFLGVGSFGLLLGHFFFVSVGVFQLLNACFKYDRQLVSCINLSSLKHAVNKYRRFITMSVPESLANVAGQQVPILIIASMAVGAAAGYLTVALQIFAIPMILLGQSVHQVFMADAPKHCSSGAFLAYIQRFLGGLTVIGVFVFGIIYCVVSSYSVLIFGPSWAELSSLAIWLVPWHVLQLITSPISGVLHVTLKLGLALNLQIFGFVLRLGSVLIALYCESVFIVEIFCISSAVYYILYLITIIVVASREDEINR